MRDPISPCSDAIRRFGTVPLLALGFIALVSALASSVARADVVNNLVQIGLGLHNGGNDLSQLGLALHSGSYAAPDGSVHFISGDGSVRFISVGTDAQAVLCLHNVTTTGDIHDGTSNTLLFGESVGLRFTGGNALAPSSIRDIADGTSNTISFAELPLTQFCIDNVRDLDPVTGPHVGDGLSNTIVFGENSSFDLCFDRAGLPSIADGTSNTILLAETRNGVCLNNIVVSGDVAVVSTVAEPATVALALESLLAFAGFRRRERVRLRTRLRGATAP